MTFVTHETFTFEEFAAELETIFHRSNMTLCRRTAKGKYKHHIKYIEPSRNVIGLKTVAFDSEGWVGEGVGKTQINVDFKSLVSLKKKEAQQSWSN